MSKRLDEIDILTTFSCIFVIFIHLTANPVATFAKGSIQLTLFFLFNQILTFVVPCFIFLSGLKLYYNHKDKEFNYFKFSKKRFPFIIIPYIFWAVIFYLYFIRIGYYSFDYKFFLKNLALGDLLGHFYFVIAIIQFYFLFEIFLKMFKKYNGIIVLSVLFIINILYIRYSSFKYDDRIFLTYIFFFGLGCYASTNLDKFKLMLHKYKYYLIASYCIIAGFLLYNCNQAYVLQKGYSNVFHSTFNANFTRFIFSIISILFFYFISIAISEKLQILIKFFREVSKGSYYIYLSHPLAILVLNRFWDEHSLFSIKERFILNTILVFLTVFPLAILYVLGKSRVKNLFSNKEYSL